MITGFSPRRRGVTVDIMPGLGHFDKLMSKPGGYKTGMSCLYTRRLADVDETVPERLVQDSVECLRQHYDTR
jgi:hypothetical protein